jgi:hypothetical protein
VSLLDIFEIDNETFATVLELVRGGDLDAYCKLHEASGRYMAMRVQHAAAGGQQVEAAPGRHAIHATHAATACSRNFRSWACTLPAHACAIVDASSSLVPLSAPHVAHQRAAQTAVAA